MNILRVLVWLHVVVCMISSVPYLSQGFRSTLMSSSVRADLCFLVHHHFGNGHVRVLLLCFLNSLGQSLSNGRHKTGGEGGGVRRRSKWNTIYGCNKSPGM